MRLEDCITLQKTEIHAHAVEVGELRTKLQKALRNKFSASPETSPSGSEVPPYPMLGGPYIDALFPNECHVVYSHGDKKFRHAYNVGDDGSVSLKGNPQEVTQGYMPVGKPKSKS